MIRAVIFDAGGVLLRQRSTEGRALWERRLGLGPGDLDRLSREAVGPGWQGGRSEEQIEERFLELTGIDRSNLRDLRDAMNADTHVDPELQRFVAEIRPAYRVGVLANNGPRAREEFTRHHRLHELADVMVISGEEGIAKPDARIYRIAASRLGVEPHECAFVDDLAANVEGARAVGMTAILHVSATATISALRRLFAGTA